MLTRPGSNRSARHTGPVPAIALPTIADGEITLRPPRPEDAGALTAACQDPEIPRWTLVPSPYLREHAEAWLERVAASAREGSSLGLLAFDDAGRLLGSFSLMALDNDRRCGEIGYWVAAEARGRGVATRAVRLLRDWGHRELGLALIEILVHAGNVPSRRVAERAGFLPTGELRGHPRAEDPGEPDYEVLAWHAA